MLCYAVGFRFLSPWFQVRLTRSRRSCDSRLSEMDTSSGYTVCSQLAGIRCIMVWRWVPSDYLELDVRNWCHLHSPYLDNVGHYHHQPLTLYTRRLSRTSYLFRSLPATMLLPLIPLLRNQSWFGVWAFYVPPKPSTIDHKQRGWLVCVTPNKTLHKSVYPNRQAVTLQYTVWNRESLLSFSLE